MAVSDQTVHLAALAADEVGVFFQGTRAERTRAVLRRALEALEANGIIYIVPDENHPFFFTPYPPYGASQRGMLMEHEYPEWKGEV